MRDTAMIVLGIAVLALAAGAALAFMVAAGEAIWRHRQHHRRHPPAIDIDYRGRRRNPPT